VKANERIVCTCTGNVTSYTVFIALLLIQGIWYKDGRRCDTWIPSVFF